MASKSLRLCYCLMVLLVLGGCKSTPELTVQQRYENLKIQWVKTPSLSIGQMRTEIRSSDNQGALVVGMLLGGMVGAVIAQALTDDKDDSGQDNVQKNILLKYKAMFAEQNITFYPTEPITYPLDDIRRTQFYFNASPQSGLVVEVITTITDSSSRKIIVPLDTVYAKTSWIMYDRNGSPGYEIKTNSQMDATLTLNRKSSGYYAIVNQLQEQNVHKFITSLQYLSK